MDVIRIQVKKRALYGDLAEAHSDADVRKCEVFEDGQEFISSNFAMPEGFCGWAWSDLNKYIVALNTGGGFNTGLFNGWMKNGKSFLGCCTDGLRPVTFLMERVDTAELVKKQGEDWEGDSEVYTTERWGDFTYTLEGLEAGKDYMLRLHFCEIFFSGPGRRLFHVEAGGERILEDFDIYEAAGSSYKPVIRDFELVADGEGKIVAGFILGAVDKPKISALEILKGGKTVLAINAGGDDSGRFRKDCCFEGGQSFGG